MKAKQFETAEQIQQFVLNDYHLQSTWNDIRNYHTITMEEAIAFFNQVLIDLHKKISE